MYVSQAKILSGNSSEYKSLLEIPMRILFVHSCNFNHRSTQTYRSDTATEVGRRFTPVGEGGSGRRPLPPQSLNSFNVNPTKMLSLYCIVGLV